MRLVSMAARACAAGIVLAGAGLAPAMAQDQSFNFETLADGLQQPWSAGFLPDGAILVTEKPGRLRVVRNGQLESDPIDGLPDDIYWDGQAGLFDVVPHPDFAANGLIYITYAAGTADSNATRVIRARYDGGAALSNVEEIYTVTPNKNTNGHFGGRLAFLNDGTFVLAVGDGFRQRERAQRLDTTIGKMVRLNDDGSIPSDNPFVGRDGALPEIWSLGHRSPQGLAVDPATGALYETEHGPWGGDELNVIQPGLNYGWPIVTSGRDYNGARISPFTELDGMESPALEWTPVIAASGLAVYRGDLFPAWNGDVLAGGLAGAGPGQGAVVRVSIDAAGNASEQERLFDEVGQRIRDVRVGPDGAVYLVTDHPADGRLIRVTPAQ